MSLVFNQGYKSSLIQCIKTLSIYIASVKILYIKVFEPNIFYPIYLIIYETQLIAAAPIFKKGIRFFSISSKHFLKLLFVYRYALS